ncbi:MAG: hypothetical protein WCK43_02100, partial [bacterium]
MAPHVKRLSLCFIFSVLTIKGALSGEAKKTYEELPDQYKKAFKINAYQKNPQSFEVFLETLNGYSVYKETLEIKAEYFRLELKEATPALKSLDPLSQKIKEFYKDQNTFLFELKNKKENLLKEFSIKLQACSKENCLLPVSFTIPILNSPKEAPLPSSTLN